MCPWFLVESTAPSPAIGMGYVDYDILDGDGGTIRSITRRFTMANVQIRADLDGDGSIGIDDTYLRALDIGAVIPWRIAQRDTPYRIVFQNESATFDGMLSVSLTASDSLFPNLYAASGSATLFPGQATNASPICVRNATTSLLLDTSWASNVTAMISYSLDFEGCHPAINSTLNLQILHVDIPNFVIRTNELADVVYDYSHVGSNIVWTLTEDGSENLLDACEGPIYTPPSTLTNGLYRVSAHYGDVFDDGLAVRSASLTVCPIELEPITNEFGIDGHLYNPAGIVVGETGKFKITVGDPNIPDSDIVWSGNGITFSNGQSTGRVVTVSPTSAGLKTLTVTVRGLVGNPPQIQFQGLPDHKLIPIRVTMIADAQGNLPTNSLSLVQGLSTVNEIFAQAGMSFYLSGTIVVVTNQSWFAFDIGDDGTMNEIFTTASSGNGINIYINKDIDYGQDSMVAATGVLEYDGSSFGIIIPSIMNPVVLAHEIGHCCGLRDIYYRHLDGLGNWTDHPQCCIPVVKRLMPMDWTGVSSYYPPHALLCDYLPRLLMEGTGDMMTTPTTFDIPVGQVSGMSDSGRFELVPIGLSDLCRTPTSLDGAILNE